MLVRQGFVELDLIRDLFVGRGKKQKCDNQYASSKHNPGIGSRVVLGPLCKTQKSSAVYLVPLVRFGHPALWDHLHGVHFVGGEVCHLVASSEATLGETDKVDRLRKSSRLKTCNGHSLLQKARL